jgi:hypothetical protein
MLHQTSTLFLLGVTKTKSILSFSSSDMKENQDKSTVLLTFQQEEEPSFLRFCPEESRRRNI